jgi:hypothetical protein
VCYYAPDSMEWESLEMGHGTWLYWLLTPDRLAQFYQGLRWTGWQADIAGLPLDQGISVFPPPWSKEAHDDFDATSRRPVSIYELFSVHGGPPRPLTGG